jgi:WD40 repeat protein
MINRKSEIRHCGHVTHNRWVIPLIIMALTAFACDLPAGLIPTAVPPTQIVATVASLPTQGLIAETVEPTISVELGPTSTPSATATVANPTPVNILPVIPGLGTTELTPQSGIIMESNLGSLSIYASIKAHDNRTASVAFSPDGLMLATGAYDKLAKVWSTATWMRMYRFQGHDFTIFQVAISPDSTRMATASNDGSVKIWNLTNGHLLKTITGFESTVHSVAFNPAGDLLIAGAGDGTLHVFSTSTWGHIQLLTGHRQAVNSLAFSNDGVLLASAADDGMVLIWQMPAGAMLRRMEV